MDSMMEDFSSIYSSVSDRFWEEFRSEIQPDELTTMMVPVYQKHLTAEEVDELIRFFSTPVGRSFIRKQPDIMTDSMKIGADWGERIAERVLEKLESEITMMAAAMPAAVASTARNASTTCSS